MIAPVHCAHTRLVNSNTLKLDLVRFIEKNFGPLNAMMERAGMSEMDIYHRTRDVFHHYKLPFDAEPPE